eukprot:3668656-Amphidinium_carterae.2
MGFVQSHMCNRRKRRKCTPVRGAAGPAYPALVDTEHDIRKTTSLFPNENRGTRLEIRMSFSFSRAVRHSFLLKTLRRIRAIGALRSAQEGFGGAQRSDSSRGAHERFSFARLLSIKSDSGALKKIP